MSKTNNNYSSLPPSYMEPVAGHESLAKKRGSGLHQKCCLHVLSRTKKLADEDGRSCKAAVDGLREAGLLEDDNPECVKKVSQSQELTTGDEETIIEITFEDPQEV